MKFALFNSLNWKALVFYGNPLQDWGIALGIFLGSLLVMQIIKKVVLKRLKVLAELTPTKIDDWIVELLMCTRSFLLLTIALYLASLALILPEKTDRFIQTLPIIALLIQLALWGNQSIGFLVDDYRARKLEIEGDPVGATMSGIFGVTARIALWVIVVLLILDNVGVNITTLIAGLGIGGVAVALAIQNILGDLLASFSIMLDKPFVIGDMITVDDLSGTVEHIGLKTTRLNSLSGEQLIFSNADLLKSRIRNYKRMTERRVLFILGVVYDTPLEIIERIPRILKEIVETRPLARFERSHFKGIGASAMEFETVYFVADADYNVFMDTHQAVLLELVRRFSQEDIVLAYPTQTVYLHSIEGHKVAQ